jgi:glycosyltransferase involved in cell wall biosynthesis
LGFSVDARGAVLRCAHDFSGQRASRSDRYPMTLKIAHVNVARGYRGGERQTELLIRALRGVDAEQVLVARRGAPLASRLADAVEVRAVSGSTFSVAGATADVELVHVHEGRSVYGAYLRWLLSRTPYVITRRVNNPIRPHWFAHRAYRRAACVAAVAPQVADVVRSYDSGIRLAVVHSSSSSLPVDDDRVRAIRAAYPNQFIVGHVGALDNDQKGQIYIIAVARELQLSHRDIHFMLVGSGDDEGMLKSAASGLSNVTFTGFVENVGDYLAAFDVFVLPSNREGIGSVLLDAMDRALPVVASRVGGVPDIVHDGENGILIDPARPDQLRNGILALCADPDRRRILGENGREVAKNYTASVMARKYLGIYSAALGRAV